MTNVLRVIAPYKYEGVWVFDDSEVDLVREPFVCGADAMLDRLVRSIPDAEKGFLLYFSPRPFPGFQIKIEWSREEYGGHWYRLDEPSMEAWLCPALLKYFPDPPGTIYVKADAKRENIIH